MSRYRSYGQLDDQHLSEGDRGFRGIDSYKEKTSLEGGFVEKSENMRLVGDLAETRKGIDFLAGSVTLTYNGPMSEFFVRLYSATPRQALNS